jgi:hypothetical protein
MAPPSQELEPPINPERFTAGFRTYAEQRREDRGLEQHALMVVDLIFESCVPFRIGAGLIRLPIDRLSTGSTLRMRGPAEPA